MLAYIEQVIENINYFQKKAACEWSFFCGGKPLFGFDTEVWKEGLDYILNLYARFS